MEHATAPLTISWQLEQSQSACRISVSRLPVSPSLAATLVWDSGLVRSNRTAAPYAVGGGPAQPLESDADYAWTVQWCDADGAPSDPARATFSAKLHGARLARRAVGVDGRQRVSQHVPNIAPCASKGTVPRPAVHCGGGVL